MNSPFFKRKSDGQGYEGFLMDLLEILQGKLGFEYQFGFSDHKGFLENNGSWNGLIGELVERVNNTLLIKSNFLK